MVGDTKKPHGFAYDFPCVIYIEYIQSPKTVKMFFPRNPISFEGQCAAVQRSSSFFLLIHFLGDILEGPRQLAFSLSGRV